MKTICPLFVILLSVLLVCSCADLLNFPLSGNPAPVPTSAQYFREKALTLEDGGELRQALLAWQIAATLEQDRQTRQALSALEQTIANTAELNFKDGLTDYRNGEFAKARQAFLKTIRLVPTHKGARYYLKTRLHTTEQGVYKVRRGDSYSKIASQNYGDIHTAYLIAYYNDLDPLKPLLAGTTLLLPVLDMKSGQPKTSVTIWITKAQKALNQKRYDTALALVDKLKKRTSGNPKVLQISDRAHYGKGMQYLNHQKQLAALNHLKQVRPSFPGRKKALAQARGYIQKQALAENLKLAEQHLSNKEYESVINITEEILRQSHANTQAKALFNEAHYALGKQLLESGEMVAAANFLEKADKTYKDTSQLLSLAKAKIRSEADAHYRKGVNYFINEDLERAVAEWRRALALHPQHPKARQNIENATRLLKKYKALETKQ